jgi:hypothetical protein
MTATELVDSPRQDLAEIALGGVARDFATTGLERAAKKWLRFFAEKRAIQKRSRAFGDSTESPNALGQAVGLAGMPTSPGFGDLQIWRAGRGQIGIFTRTLGVLV